MEILMKDETLTNFFMPLYFVRIHKELWFVWEQCRGDYPHSRYELLYLGKTRKFGMFLTTREFGRDWSPIGWTGRSAMRPDLIDEFKARLTPEHLAMCARLSLTGSP
jgi:hypothetical protein